MHFLVWCQAHGHLCLFLLAFVLLEVTLFNIKFNVCCIDVIFYSDYILLFIQDYYNKSNIPIISI